ncbi:hypothetical protein [Microbispora hainanensis]|uniref:Uncharacterized protein n=1 Tax=Microbispora hainanensis TaxID=568844 RepID=A0A544Y589_9ACTN|nr:hypothetical protein [Microbispora hainanensis]TQS11722.1 hypothetical protein FLX08_36900 [Microbispora hainanensis]
MLFELASGPNWNSKLAAFIEHAYAPEVNDALQDAPDLSPSLDDAGNGFRRGRGAARATRNLGEGRIFTPISEIHPEDAFELQVHEDGGLRLFTSRFSSLDSDAGEQVILISGAVSHTRRFLSLIRAAAEQAGYFGNWALGLGATGLNGLRAYTSRNTNNWLFTPQTRYDEEDYREATTVTWAELNEAPRAVTRRLAGPLLRALSTEDRFMNALVDPPK